MNKLFKIAPSLLLLLFAWFSGLTAFNILPESLFPSHHAHKAYQEKNYAKAQQILEKKQVETPNDPLLNYNLGTTYYKQKKYQPALESFRRSATHAFGKNNTIVEQARFNSGNCLYNQTLEILGSNWEKEKPDAQTLQKAVTKIKQAIESYNKTLTINKENEKAQTNKKIAEELLKKLQQQQQQQKKDDKNKDKEKDKEKEKQDKKDKDEQQKQDKQQQDKQDKKDQQQKQDKQQQDKQKEKQEEDKQKQQQQQQKDEQKQQDKEQQQQQQDKQDKKDEEQQQQQQQAQQGDKKNPQEQTLEQRRMTAVLNNLEQQEKDLQKKLFKQKVDMQVQPDNKFQKPW